MTGAGGDPVPDRKEAEVRRMLDTPHPAPPPDLADRAMEHGRRLLRRRRRIRVALWTLALAAVVAAAVLAAAAWPPPQPLNVPAPTRSW